MCCSWVDFAQDTHKCEWWLNVSSFNVGRYGTAIWVAF
jgi:hypothetical protein